MDSHFLLAESYKHWTLEPKQGRTRSMAMILDKISQHLFNCLHFRRGVAQMSVLLLIWSSALGTWTPVSLEGAIQGYTNK